MTNDDWSLSGRCPHCDHRVSRRNEYYTQYRLLREHIREEHADELDANE